MGWNSPTVLQLQLKYALRPLFKNNIESPNAANCLPVSEQKCSATGSGKLNISVCGQLVCGCVILCTWICCKTSLESIDCSEYAAALYNNSSISVSHDYTSAVSSDLQTIWKFAVAILSSLQSSNLCG